MKLNADQLDRAIASWLNANGAGDRVLVLTNVAVDVRGRVSSKAVTVGSRAVLRLDSLDEGAVLEHLDGETLTVERVFCDLGILEPTDDGLVIVELAPGVAATDLQALVRPTLKVTHEVAEMVLN